MVAGEGHMGVSRKRKMGFTGSYTFKLFFLSKVVFTALVSMHVFTLIKFSK